MEWILTELIGEKIKDKSAAENIREVCDGKTNPRRTDRRAEYRPGEKNAAQI